MRLTLSHPCCRARMAPRHDAPTMPERPLEEGTGFDHGPVVATPNGPAAADEAFRWVNRQVTWQSLLADLEVIAWLTETDASQDDGTAR